MDALLLKKELVGLNQVIINLIFAKGKAVTVYYILSLHIGLFKQFVSMACICSTILVEVKISVLDIFMAGMCRHYRKLQY